MSDLEERDWTQLLPELIHLIAKKLPDVLNFVRFRYVCKTWQSSTPLFDPPTQFPWIHTISLESRSSLFGGRQSFYSIASAETLTINVRAPRADRIEKDFMGVCSHNVLFIYHRGPFIDWSHCADLHFYNPLTKKQFALERVPLPLYKPVIVWTGTDPLYNRSLLIIDDDLFPKKPNETTGLAFFDPHHKNWIVHKGSFSNAFLCQGMLFTIEANGYTMVRNLPSKILSHMIPPPDDEIKRVQDGMEMLLTRMLEAHTFIFDSCGIILRVTQSWRRQKTENSIFYIYKLQFDGVNGKPCWVKLNNIGNQVLFLDGKVAFSMNARPSTGFKKGCIYFINRYKRPYVYDVLAGTTERVSVPSSFKFCYWFVPGLF